MSVIVDKDVLDFNQLSPDEINLLLKQYRIALSIEEVLTIQNKLLQRPPTLSECILWSIQGSEHCSYKSSRTHLKKMITDGPNIILGAKEDAGIVSVATDNMGMRYGIVISHESHNHPSQIVPYEGAATGVGGNVRDVCCMGAEVIAIADGLRFGDIYQPKTSWISDQVVAGIAGYGNPIGVPTIAGDVYYDPGYNDNCLVTVVTLGIVKEEDVIHSYAPQNAEDYVFILVGKPTDNSGFGGASFASMEFGEHADKNKGAVQEPNAFLKRHLLKANYAFFKFLKRNKLIDKVGFKDLGAGGIACASVEMAENSGYGAEINLNAVPVSMQNLHPSVILCSETQERFMWVVPSELIDTILTHYNDTFALPTICQHAQAKVVGRIRKDGQYIVTYNNEQIVDAKACDITKGLIYDRPYIAKDKTLTEPTLPAIDCNATLLQLLAHENIASRLPIFERYDKQVQGRTVIEAGEADAGVMQPFNDDSFPEEIRQTGIALSLDQCPRYNKIDAYWGAVNAVIEAVRNVAAVGATPQSITDCLCFGNPEKPEHMFDFTESIRGIIDACAAVGLKEYPQHSLPIISGNVSFYNESAQNAIPPSPMISCLGNASNINTLVSKNLQSINSTLVLVGERLDECGGSVFYDLHGVLGANVPKPNLKTIRHELHAVIEAIQAGYVLSSHDISEGGAAVALAEMTFKNNIGIHAKIPSSLPIEKTLFSETGGFILEVLSNKLFSLQKIFKHYNVYAEVIGKTNAHPIIKINDVISVDIAKAKQIFENGLREKLL